jgi:hypothetical protein
MNRWRLLLLDRSAWGCSLLRLLVLTPCAWIPSATHPNRMMRTCCSATRAPCSLALFCRRHCVTLACAASPCSSCRCSSCLCHKLHGVGRQRSHVAAAAASRRRSRQHFPRSLQAQQPASLLHAQQQQLQRSTARALNRNLLPAMVESAGLAALASACTQPLRFTVSALTYGVWSLKREVTRPRAHGTTIASDREHKLPRQIKALPPYQHAVRVGLALS